MTANQNTPLPTPVGMMALLLGLAKHGQSVTLTWDDDEGWWQCSWITSGERFIAGARGPYAAAEGAWKLAQHQLTASKEPAES